MMLLDEEIKILFYPLNKPGIFNEFNRNNIGNKEDPLKLSYISSIEGALRKLVELQEISRHGIGRSIYYVRLK